MLGNATISWSSKQILVALSTKEAEYTAFREASREALWYCQLLSDIDNWGSQPDPKPSVPLAHSTGTVIYEDNQSERDCLTYIYKIDGKHGRRLHERAASTKPPPPRCGPRFEQLR